MERIKAKKTISGEYYRVSANDVLSAMRLLELCVFAGDKNPKTLELLREWILRIEKHQKRGSNNVTIKLETIKKLNRLWKEYVVK